MGERGGEWAEVASLSSAAKTAAEVARLGSPQREREVSQATGCLRARVAESLTVLGHCHGVLDEVVGRIEGGGPPTREAPSESGGGSEAAPLPPLAGVEDVSRGLEDLLQRLLVVRDRL
jgi:hypothetical protein